MGQHEREQLAHELLDLTRSLLELAKAGDWVLLAAKEEERQRIARDLFATPVPPEAAPTVADCVRQVLDIDQQLLALVEAGREEAAKAMQDVKAGHKAAAAYRRFSR